MMPAITVINGILLALSSSLAASIVLKATLTLALGLLAFRLARRSRAAVRHALLAAIFGVLLALPIASLVAPAVRISIPAPAPPSANDQERIVRPFPAVAEAIPSVAPAHTSDGLAPVVTYVVTPVVSRPPRLSTSTMLLAIWIVGTALFLLPMALGLWQVRRLRRSAAPWPHGQAILKTIALDAGIRRRVEMLLHPALPGPMTCGVVHPAILLPEDAQTWAEDDLNRAIVHELEHVRRADWISQCFARAVCAAYWFHPLVWIAWRRFALEAERSCDDAVLDRSDATAYADQLVALAQRMSQTSRAMTAKSPLLAMANRADLAARVGALLDTRQRRGRAGTLFVALACAAAVAMVLTVSPLRMVAAPQSTSTNVSVAPTPAPVAIAAAPQVVATPAIPPVRVAPPPALVAIAAAPQPLATPAVSPVWVAPPWAPVAIAAAPQAVATPAVPPAWVAPPRAPVAIAAAPQAPRTPASAVPRFSAKSILVIVDITVSDKNGNPIEGLSGNDFSATEDGVPQRISVFEFQKLAQTIGVQNSLSSYYILGYYPTNPNLDGGYRKIEITRRVWGGSPPAADTIGKMDHRTGYYARSATSATASGTPQDDADLSAASNSTPPFLITKYEPEYSVEARKAKWQGTAHLDIVVDEHGFPSDIRVTRALGLGLDQKAMEAVIKWRFKPATKDGKPVTSQAQVDVEFRLF